MITTSSKIFIKRLGVLVLVLTTFSPESFAAARQKPEDNGLMLLRSCRAALAAQTSAVDDKADPLKILSEQMAAISCIGFVDGMMAMNALYQGFVVDPEHRGGQQERGLFCLPPTGVTVFEAIQVVVKHLESVSVRELESSQRRLFVLVALAKQFPCKANQADR